MLGRVIYQPLVGLGEVQNARAHSLRLQTLSGHLGPAGPFAPKFVYHAAFRACFTRVNFLARTTDFHTLAHA